MNQHRLKHIDINGKNNQAGFRNHAFKDERLSAQRLNLQEATRAETKSCLLKKKARRTQRLGEDAGPFSFYELCCLYYVPSVSCYSWLPVSAGRGLSRKSGDGGAQEGIPGHKTFTSFTARIPGRNNACRRRKDTEGDRQGGGGGR